MRYCVACGGDPYSEHVSYWCDDGDPDNHVKLNSTLIDVGLGLMCVRRQALCLFLPLLLVGGIRPAVRPAPGYLAFLVIISQFSYHRFGSAPCEHPPLLPASAGRPISI